jgi:glycine dehydrogenase subunit 2
MGIDEYIDTLKKIVEEAYEDPEKVKNAPYRSVVHKIIEDPLDDPSKWAVTWRAFVRKQRDLWKSDNS